MATTTVGIFPVLLDNPEGSRDLVVPDAVPGYMAGELTITADDEGRVILTVRCEDDGASIYVSPLGAKQIISKLTQLL